MIKKIVKFLLIALLILAIAIFYLSFFGIKTDKFNKQINNNILKINKRINLNLGEVRYLLNPYNFEYYLNHFTLYNELSKKSSISPSNTLSGFELSWLVRLSLTIL